MTVRRRALLLALLMLAALPVAGALYQTLSVRSESRRFPPPGQLIDVAAPGESAPRRIHLVCLGQGEPTVIFEASGFGGALASTVAREELSAHARVCSYDRMGMGWSDPGPGVITASMLSDDLERLTIRAELKPPFILVPASIGGLTTELFARRHPDRVAGLVFVDAANSAVLDRFAPQLTWTETEGACLGKTAARLGILRFLDPFSLRKDPSEDAAQTLSRLYRVEPMSTLCGLVRGFQSTTQELSAAPALAPYIPLTVLIHERPDRLLPPGFESKARLVAREWLPLQQSFARRSSRGTWRVVPGSDHLIGHTQPHAVASAVLEMIAVVRQSEPRP